MTSNDSQTAAELQGRMLLFWQPELFNAETHSDLGLAEIDRPFDFASKATAIPLTIGELSTAQKSYPIVFASLEDPAPLAVTGVIDSVNLFVDDAGQWARPHYVPAYVRSYPFAFASGPDNQMAVVIDRAAPMISRNPKEAFFDNGQLSAGTQSLVDFCAKCAQDRERTERFSRKLLELNILAGQQANYQQPGQDEQSIANYVAVDTAKFQALDKDIVADLFSSGMLALIHAHLFSLENWTRLMIRRGIRHQTNSGVS
jgi:hypothetical protein